MDEQININKNKKKYNKTIKYYKQINKKLKYKNNNIN